VDGFYIWFSDWFDPIKADFVQNFIDSNRYIKLASGFGVTLQVSFLALFIGLFLGFVIAIMALSRSRFIKGIAAWYVDIMRGTPIVIQLLIIYHVFFASSRIDKAIIASIAFGLNSAAYVSEIIRAGILSIDLGQAEAGRSLGLSQTRTMISIIIPQALKNVFPALVNEFIVLIKETAVVGMIGLTDITFAGDLIRGNTFSAYMPLIGVAIVYFVFIKILSKLLKRVENRLRKSDLRTSDARRPFRGTAHR